MLCALLNNEIQREKREDEKKPDFRFGVGPGVGVGLAPAAWGRERGENRKERIRRGKIRVEGTRHHKRGAEL